jgi:hypothetical protein
MDMAFFLELGNRAQIINIYISMLVLLWKETHGRASSKSMTLEGWKMRKIFTIYISLAIVTTVFSGIFISLPIEVKGSIGPIGTSFTTSTCLGKESTTAYLNAGSGDSHYFWIWVEDDMTFTFTLNGDEALNDFDLLLYDYAHNIVASSAGSTYPEVLQYTIPTGEWGGYHIVVDPFSGSGNYWLGWTSNPEVGTSFSNAQSVLTGEGTDGLEGCNPSGSSTQNHYYYNEWGSGQSISLILNGESGTDFDAYIYDSSQNQIGYATSTSYPDVVTFVTVGTPTYMRIYKISGNGEYKFETIANYEPNTPSNPSPPDDSTDQNINIDLSWTGGDPDGDPVSYNVYFEAGDSSPDILVSSEQSLTTYNPGTLDYDIHYYWQIIAKDEHGASTDGPIWDFWTETMSPPSSPTLYDPGDDDDGTYTVSWSSESTATSYTLEEDDNSGFSSPSVVYTGSGTSKLISGKGNGIYYYRVKASNSGGDSPWSNIIDIIVDIPTAPSTPTLYDPGSTDDDGSYTVSWSTSTGATSYTLEEDDNSGFSSPTVVYSGSGTSNLISGKDDGTFYYRVKAFNSYGESDWSNIVDIIVDIPTPPSTPTLIDPGSTDDDGSYSITWSSESGATSYTLEEDDNSVFSSPTVVYTGSGTSNLISGKDDGTFYYRVKASNSYGESDWSNIVDIIISKEPEGNYNLVISSVSHEQLILGGDKEFIIDITNQGNEDFPGGTCLLDFQFWDEYETYNLGWETDSFPVWKKGFIEQDINYEEEIYSKVVDRYLNQLSPDETQSIVVDILIDKFHSPSLLFTNTINLSLIFEGNQVSEYPIENVFIGLSFSILGNVGKEGLITGFGILVEWLFNAQLPGLSEVLTLTEAQSELISESFVRFITSIENEDYGGAAEAFYDYVNYAMALDPIWNKMPTNIPYRVEIYILAIQKYLEGITDIAQTYIFLEILLGRLQQLLYDAGIPIPLNIFLILSPADILVNNSKGERVGFVNGEKIIETENASVLIKNETKLVLIFKVDKYYINLTGTDSGKVSYIVQFPTIDNKIISLDFRDFEVIKGTKINGYVDPFNSEYYLELDYDGDGKLEKIFSSDLPITLESDIDNMISVYIVGEEIGENHAGIISIDIGDIQQVELRNTGDTTAFDIVIERYNFLPEEISNEPPITSYGYFKVNINNESIKEQIEISLTFILNISDSNDVDDWILYCYDEESHTWVEEPNRAIKLNNKEVLVNLPSVNYSLYSLSYNSKNSEENEFNYVFYFIIIFFIFFTIFILGLLVKRKYIGKDFELDESLDIEDLRMLFKDELIEMAVQRDLDIDGSKEELIQRIIDYEEQKVIEKNF